MRQLSIFPEMGFANGRIAGTLGSEAPIIVSNGVGDDSIAMLIELHRLGVRPDAVVTAMVGRDWFGNEHRRFYEYLPIMEEWLALVSFPAPNYVWYEMKREAKHFTYLSLAGNCLANRMLPSISYRRNHSCSIKYKGAEIDRWVTAQYGERPCYRLVGYDLGEGYRNARFSTKAAPTGPRANDVYIYPLQLLGMNRQACQQSIIDADLPLPGKSSCVFCASMKPEELDDLYPEELWIIVILEANAAPKLQAIKGLWGHAGRMTDYIVMRGLLPGDLVQQVWEKWAAEERPPDLRDNPQAVADEVLFAEVKRLAALTGVPVQPEIATFFSKVECEA
ncbi:MAG: hypothetical protein IAE79_05805 [Anaerolinea sp.]|nr:hypothetical protein [Anaerolinea sp.]